MKLLKTLLLTEIKLSLRAMDSVFFGILFPIGLAIVLGAIFGDKLAYDGASYTWLQQSFAAVGVVGICATGLMGLPLTVSDYRDKKVRKRFRVTPVSPGALLLVQILLSLGMAIISTLGVYGVYSVFFGYRMLGSLLPFTLSYALVAIAIYSLGLLLASLAGNIKVANLICTLVYFPMLFLSGATIPYEVMPTRLQYVANALPLTHGIRLLKGISLGYETESLSLPILVMIALAVGCTILSLRFFRWE